VAAATRREERTEGRTPPAGYTGSSPAITLHPLRLWHHALVLGDQALSARTDPQSIIYGKHRRLPDFDYSNPDVAFFVTSRSRPGTAPFQTEALNAEVISTLNWLHTHRGISIYAYALLPDHLHLLLRLGGDKKSLSDLMNSMKTFTTKQSWKLGCSGQLWQHRFHDHVVRMGESGALIAEYILQNPVRRGLVNEAAEYLWSGTPDPM
jgi:REP element-mobilizing transposase RayT